MPVPLVGLPPGKLSSEITGPPPGLDVLKSLSIWLKSDAAPSMACLFLSEKVLFSGVKAEEFKLSKRFKAMSCLRQGGWEGILLSRQQR